MTKTLKKPQTQKNIQYTSHPKKTHRHGDKQLKQTR